MSCWWTNCMSYLSSSTYIIHQSIVLFSAFPFTRSVVSHLLTLDSPLGTLS